MYYHLNSVNSKRIIKFKNWFNSSVINEQNVTYLTYGWWDSLRDHVMQLKLTPVLLLTYICMVAQVAASFKEEITLEDSKTLALFISDRLHTNFELQTNFRYA